MASEVHIWISLRSVLRRCLCIHKPAVLVTCLILMPMLVIFTLVGLHTPIVNDRKMQRRDMCSHSERMNKRMEKSFSKFSWPFEGDIVNIVKRYQEGRTDVVKPVYPLRYSFSIENPDACKTERGKTLLFVYIVKSTVFNFKKREKIREQWGVRTKDNIDLYRTLFVVGSGLQDDHSLMEQVHQESKEHGDLIQCSFFDTYRNNTEKTIMAYNWVNRHCGQSKFVVFVDDDVNVNTAGVVDTLTAVSRDHTDEHYFTGLLTGSKLDPPIPYRNECSKWFVSLKDYPYKHWPLYVHGGFYMASSKTVSDVAIAMLFTKSLWIDDAYIGIVLHRLGLTIKNCPRIVINCLAYDQTQLDRFVLDKTLLANHCDFTFKS